LLRRLLDRRCRRLGRRYIPRAVGIQGHLLYPVVVLAVAMVSAYVHMSLGEYLRLALLGCLLQLWYTLLSVRIVARLSQPSRGSSSALS
jgi:hypothetical protein